MCIDLKFVELTADVLDFFQILYWSRTGCPGAEDEFEFVFSCKMEDFVVTCLRKLCLIPRLRVLLGVCPQ